MDKPDAHVLAVAAADFAEHGFDGVSMRLLAEKCEVSTTWLYYHFESKEALYKEACSHAIADTFRAVLQRLSGHPLAQRRPEMIVTAFFDEWAEDQTTLLLVQRDVISALKSPDRWLTGTAYPKTLALMRELYVSYLGDEPDKDFAFAFASLMYGFCSLMIIDERTLHETGAPEAREAFIRQKRAALERFARQMLPREKQ